MFNNKILTLPSIIYKAPEETRYDSSVCPIVIGSLLDFEKNLKKVYHNRLKLSNKNTTNKSQSVQETIKFVVDKKGQLIIPDASRENNFEHSHLCISAIAAGNIHFTVHSQGSLVKDITVSNYDLVSGSFNSIDKHVPCLMALLFIKLGFKSIPLLPPKLSEPSPIYSIEDKKTYEKIGQLNLKYARRLYHDGFYDNPTELFTVINTTEDISKSSPDELIEKILDKMIENRTAITQNRHIMLKEKWGNKISLLPIKEPETKNHNIQTTAEKYGINYEKARQEAELAQKAFFRRAKL